MFDGDYNAVFSFSEKKGESKEVCIFATINLGRNGFTVSTADFSGGLAEGIRRGFFVFLYSHA